MNLIEKLGGYEEAKKIRVAFDATHYCISRKSQMKMFSVGVIGSATIAHSIACGFRETKLEDDDLVTQKQIDSALLEYRKQHGIFEIGDKVVYALYEYDEEPMEDFIMTVSSEIDEFGNIAVDYEGFFTEFDTPSFFRHATDKEIEVGHRLP
jgi:hypothetical protein